MTREEHLAWCKRRAYEYLDQGDVQNAITSMMSDLQKHEETKTIAGGTIDLIGFWAATSHDKQAAKRYIDGFN